MTLQWLCVIPYEWDGLCSSASSLESLPTTGLVFHCAIANETPCGGHGSGHMHPGRENSRPAAAGYRAGPRRTGRAEGTGRTIHFCSSADTPLCVTPLRRTSAPPTVFNWYVRIGRGPGPLYAQRRVDCARKRGRRG